MFEFIKDSGLFGWMIIIIAIILFANIIRMNLRLNSVQPEDGPRMRSSINAIFFWGGVCALMGLLGQYAGMYMALEVISQAEVIDPNLVAMGLAISFSTTIMGMFTLLLSALGWFILQFRFRKLTSGWNAGQAAV